MPSNRTATAVEFVGLVGFAPIAETLLLAGIISLLSRAGFSSLAVATISAIAWGCAHAMFGALWFFGTVWAFFVFSCAYISWRKVSFQRAYIAAAAPHALINLGVLVVSAKVA
jgi:membrane protease YdiL (CAAX protease family)